MDISHLASFYEVVQKGSFSAAADGLGVSKGMLSRHVSALESTLNAQLLGVTNEGDDQYAQVFFDVLLRETPAQETPSSAREVWHFVRPVTGGNWKLDGIQQVE